MYSMVVRDNRGGRTLYQAHAEGILLVNLPPMTNNGLEIIVEDYPGPTCVEDSEAWHELNP